MVLVSVDQHRWELGLERVRRALDVLGHPERSYPHVLVAGTNGKGSTCMYLESILLEAGMTVGTTMSPHVSRFTERFRIGGKQVAVSELEGVRCDILPLVEEISLTYFEWCVVLASVLFERRKVEAAIFEVGLGGRYDASNALDPSVAIITNISLDHTDYLGNTIRAIAMEKAQIARPGRPLVTTAEGEALQVIRSHADSVCAHLHEVTGECMPHTAIPGVLQNRNAALALEAARLMGIQPSALAVEKALLRTFLPGRIEKVGRRIIMDVAHNPSSMLVLVEHLKSSGFDGVGVAGILSDKDYMGIIESLKKVCRHIFVAPVRSPRSWGAEEMRRVAATGSVTVCPSVKDAFFQALSSGVPVVVTGSFYTVGEVRELLVCPGWSS